MLGYLFRIIPTVLRQRGAPVGALSCRTRHRVTLGQIDLNRHMNQAAYPQVCELARVSWLFRSGAWPRWREAGLNPVLADQTLTYRRELAPLQTYQIDTRAVGMVGRLLRVEQHFLVNNRVHARAAVSLLFIGPDGVLSAEDATTACAGLLTDPLPVDDWQLQEG